MKFHLVTLAAQFISLAFAATTIRGSIPPSNLLINPSELPADTTITLTTSGIKRSTLLRANNSFVFRNVSEGSYILDTLCSTHHFAPLRVDVTRDGGVSVVQTFRGNAWSNSGERREMPIVSSAIPGGFGGGGWWGAVLMFGIIGAAPSQGRGILCYQRGL